MEQIHQSITQPGSRWQGHICASFCPISLSDEPFLTYGFEHSWTDCVSNSARSSPRSLFNLHLLYSFFFSSSLASSPFTPLTMCLVSALNGCRGSLLSPFSCSHCPSRVRAQREDNRRIWTIILCSYYPLSSASAAPAHPTRHPPALLSFTLPFVFFFTLLLLLKTPPSPHPRFFLTWPWKDIYKTAPEETSQGLSRGPLWHLLQYTENTHTGNEELPLCRHQVVRQKKALRWVWQIRGGEVTPLPQRWLRRGELLSPCLCATCLFVCFLCRCTMLWYFFVSIWPWEWGHICTETTFCLVFTSTKHCMNAWAMMLGMFVMGMKQVIVQIILRSLQQSKSEGTKSKSTVKRKVSTFTVMYG